MSSPTLANTNTPNSSNPSSLAPRYEIRKLGPSDALAAAAVVCHSNCFHSTVWPHLHDDMTTRVHDMLAACSYLVDHQIASGMSFGVFDTQYEYKTAEAEAAGGKLLWQRDAGASGDALLEQMDFPLVSVALSYDAFNPLDYSEMAPLVATLPRYATLFKVLGANDTRDPQSWQPTGPGQVLFRNATSTRHEYEGQGIMAGMARWLQREAEARGWRGIQIECLNDAVTHLWRTGARPYKGVVVSAFDAGTWRDEEGRLGFEGCEQRIAKCYVDLKTKV
jgi:hypothetical protein